MQHAAGRMRRLINDLLQATEVAKLLLEIGDVMRAAGIARVVESRNPHFAVGNEVYGVFGVQRQHMAISIKRFGVTINLPIATRK